MASGQRFWVGPKRRIIDVGNVSGSPAIATELGAAASRGESNVPSTVNLYQIGVGFCVGFFTGAGWAIAAWLVGRVLSAI